MVGLIDNHVSSSILVNGDIINVTFDSFSSLGKLKEKENQDYYSGGFPYCWRNQLFFWLKSFHGLSIWKLKVLLKVKDTYLNSLSESVLSSISFENSRIWHIKIMAHFTGSPNFNPYKLKIESLCCIYGWGKAYLNTNSNKVRIVQSFFALTSIKLF